MQELAVLVPLTLRLVTPQTVLNVVQCAGIRGSLPLNTVFISEINKTRFAFKVFSKLVNLYNTTSIFHII